MDNQSAHPSARPPPPEPAAARLRLPERSSPPACGRDAMGGSGLVVLTSFQWFYNATWGETLKWCRGSASNVNATAHSTHSGSGHWLDSAQ